MEKSVNFIQLLVYLQSFHHINRKLRADAKEIGSAFPLLLTGFRTFSFTILDLAEEQMLQFTHIQAKFEANQSRDG